MFGSRRGDPVVLSMMVQANLKRKTRSLGPFEILVRHFLDRLFSSEALGSSEEAGVRIAQIAYAVALPGMVFALYLFPIYHLPEGKPPFWFQCGNHFFYVAYAFVTMGFLAVLQWDLLFPDPLDAAILAGMPISGRRLLAARGCALALFFGVLLLGTSVLGIVFFPAVIDLPGIGSYLFRAHVLAVLSSGFFGICLFLAMRGLLLCLCSRLWAQRLSAVLQMFCMLALFAALLSIPFCDHFLYAIFQTGSARLFWFPPFWFLGLYEWIFRGQNAAPIFRELGHAALWACAVAGALVVATYPLAHRRRMAQVLEGGAPKLRQAFRGPAAKLLSRLAHDARARAVFHFIGQTIWRTQRTRILLAAFAGVGIASSCIALLSPSLCGRPVGLHATPAGARPALALISFCAVVCLRTVLHSSVAGAGYWAFLAIEGRPKAVHLKAAQQWVAACSMFVTLAAMFLIDACFLQGACSERQIGGQVLLGIALPLLLTDVFFLQETTLPFSTPRPYSVNDLSWIVVVYCMLLPATVLPAAQCQAWMERSALHAAIAIVFIAAAHGALRTARLRFIESDAQDIDIPGVPLAPGEIGLR
jgi:hypothetical protein